MKEFYPEWEAHFFVNINTPKCYAVELASIQNVKVISITSQMGWKQSLCRFWPFLNSAIDVFISRDCDSRFSRREVDAVNEWLESDKFCHTMKDHPYHYSYPLLAGMTGFKNPPRFNAAKAFNEYDNHDYYHHDQDFLAQVVFPYYRDSIMFHDQNSFPSPREEGRFVGQVFDSNDNTPQEHLAVL